MKQFLIAIPVFLLASCQKSDSPSPINNTTNGSGSKIKRIITSAPGTKQASVQYFEYDASNRLSKYVFTNEDSNFNPVKILDMDKTFYFYSGNDTKPSSDSLVVNGTITKNYFTYDVQNKLIKTEQFNNSGPILRRNLYTNAVNMVVRMNYFETSPGSGVLFYASLDTLFLDASARLTELRTYLPPGILLNYKETFTYNANLNPCDLLNTNQYLANYYEGSDYTFSRDRYRNNVVTQVNKPYPGTTDASNITSYSYNSSGYPVSATGIYTPDTSNPSVITPFTLKYEYY